MNNKSVLAAAVLAGVFPVLSQAQTESESPVVVTASRVAETADQALASVTVISREDIEQRQPETMLELLRMVPGVDVGRSGGPGQSTSVFLRGTNSTHTLVLVDGVRVASATTGSVAWSALTPDQIERIEIVRGARSTLYGSDAIGGVIQIFTRQPRGLSASIEAGSHDTYSANLAFGGGERVRWYLNTSAEQSEGFSAAAPNNLWSYDPDADGWNNQSLGAGMSLPVGAGELQLKSWYSQNEVETDAPSGTADTTNGAVLARYALPVSDTWHSSLGFSQAQDLYSAGTVNFTTRRVGVDWQNDIDLGRSGLVVAGLDWYQEQTSNRSGATVNFDESLTNTAGYVNWQGTSGPRTLEAGLRHDQHGAFGGVTTGQLAWSRELSSAVRVNAAYGSAFVAPSANHLYHPGTPNWLDPSVIEYAGNPGLKPEQSRDVELGLRYSASPGSVLRLALFHITVDDLIAYQGTNFQAINLDTVVIPGAELEWLRTAGRWSVALSATVQQPRDDSDDSRLLRRPDQKASLLVTRTTRRGSFSAEALAVGDRLDYGGVTLDPYQLLNLSWQRQLRNGLALQARVENLTDEQYQLADGFNTAGRSFFVGLRYAPGQR